VTRLSIEQEALVGEVANAWRAFKAERAGAEARVRALVAADVAKSVAAARQSVSASLDVALAAGVPKRALKEVTTKDRVSFESLLPTKEAEPTGGTVEPAAPDFECSWDGELIRIRLHPRSLPGSDWNPNEPEFWEGVFEHFVRPSDGEVFIDPPIGSWGTRGGAVLEWIRADQNMTKIKEWAAATAQA